MKNLKKETGKKGFITYKYKDKYIYSFYDPVNEAKRFVLTHKLKSVVISCCGTDYVNNELLKTDIDLLISFELIDFDKTVSSDKIIRANTIRSIEKELLKRNIHSSDVSLLLWHPLIETFPDVYLPKLKELKDILYKSSISANTAKTFGFLETKNFIINSLSLNNINVFESDRKTNDKTALVLSPGPSLEDHINIIENFSKNYTVFALPSVLPFLKNKKVNPDYVIAVDPGYGTFFHLSKYTKKINLITTLNINPSIFRLKNYVPLFFNYGTSLEKIFFEGTNISSSYSEGSVFINLLRLLPQMGFKEAIVIGQDFGYKNNRSHVKEGFFEQELLYWSNYYFTMEKYFKELGSLKEKTELKISNKVIETDIALKLYYQHFVGNTFDITIKLLGSCFNPISENIEKISIKEFASIKGNNKNIKTNNISVIKERQNLIVKKISIIKSVINKKINKENDIIDMLKNMFIDLENPKQIIKLTKIIKEFT